MSHFPSFRPSRPFRVLALAATLACLPAALAADAVQGVLDEFVHRQEVAGAVAWIGGAEGDPRVFTAGHADLAGERPMREDALFWIASMTKPITATAVMMLADEGLLAVDDPLSKHLPEFAELRDAAGNRVEVTIAQCLAHTSGLAELTAEESAAALTLADVMERVVEKPVGFAPGSRWQYCQSSINAAARVVEVLSGSSFPEFLETRLFAPLGMGDTTFYLSEAQLPRLATSYSRSAEGALEPAALFFLQGKSPTDRERYPLANGGLFSTAADCGRFARMILRRGELDGQRYLSEAAVEAMTSLHSGELRTGFTEGAAWGLGWCLVREPQGSTADLSPGSFGHGGAYGTQMWIDPAAGRIDLLLVQRANFPNSDDSPLRAALHRAAAGEEEP